MQQRKPTISLSMTVRGPASRVRRIIDTVRPHVDEVVLAVDGRGDPAIVDACRAICDRLLRFESPGFGSSLVGWALRQSTADWILRLDDDEIPSAALLRSLPPLVSDREITHVGFERWWLYPDAAYYIDCHPWLPDHQLRLVRNIPGIWRVGGVVHAPLGVTGARRIVPAAIYHADLLLRSHAERRDKANRYERARPGVRLEDFPTNAMYLPESCESVRTAPVPAEDRPLVAELLSTSPLGAVGGGEVASGGGHRPPLVPRSEVERHGPTLRMPPQAHAGAVAVAAAPRALPAGLACQLEVEVLNASPVPWPSDGMAGSPVRVGHSWRPRGPASGPALEGPRALFTAPVEPQARERLILDVEAPPTPGPWTLRAGLLEEGVGWFGAELELEVEVRPPAWAIPEGSRFEGTAVPSAYHGSFGLDGLDLRLVDHLDDLRAGFFVEAGANDGLSQSNTLLLELEHGWRGLLVEPVARLASAARLNRPHAIVEEAALVPFDHAERSVGLWDAGLMSVVDGATGSPELDLAHARDGASRQGGLYLERVEAPAVALSTLLDRHGVEQVSLLVLDVEGFEAAALRGLDLKRHAPRHILIEARERDDVDALLRERYEVVAELSHHDVLYRRRAVPVHRRLGATLGSMRARRAPRASRTQT